MSDGIWQLAYFSKNTIPGGDEALAAAISGILEVSRRNNARVGVTGALLFNSGGFAQILEGPRDAVSDTFERIQCDPRHAEVIVLSFAAAEARLFGTWSMGFVGRSRAGERLFGAVGARSGFDARAVAAADAAGHLRRLILEEESSAAA